MTTTDEVLADLRLLMTSHIRRTDEDVVIAATGTWRHVVILWDDKPVRCCPTQGSVWREGTVPSVWDSSGLGDIQFASWAQCGGCGRLVAPAHIVFTDPSDEQVNAAVIDLARRVADAEAATEEA